MTGDDLTRGTIRAALLLYAAALLTMPHLTPAGWRAHNLAGRVTRACWQLGLLFYLIHVALAFHYFHHWSHSEAIRHVEERSGFGPGILFSHLFTLVWAADAVWWTVRPDAYARRRAWVGYVLHGYMLFMAFNATVVYETGVTRIAGIAASVLLAASVALRFRGATK